MLIKYLIEISRRYLLPPNSQLFNTTPVVIRECQIFGTADWFDGITDPTRYDHDTLRLENSARQARVELFELHVVDTNDIADADGRKVGQVRSQNTELQIRITDRILITDFLGLTNKLASGRSVKVILRFWIFSLFVLGTL